ncbi:hypothetical protein ABB26_09925 [Stenotrophomonas humi]|uniref:Peptidase S74 domain-containing protein n=1 Tax=Stenotrophomonas humi TaxID=405444 RepID=A0A0R0CDF4_9GAMM|nr:tail fiber domain-containing protein [Stenotrophomonas humi]KRG63892.1 hypothetical protein ABB26_09925 [Stenotrophomonas humi]
MAGSKIKLKDQLGRVVRVGGEATPGATVGRDLRWPDGTIVKLGEIKNPAVDSSTGGMAPTLWKLIREIPSNIQKLAKLAGVGFTTRDADGEWYQRTIEAGEGIEVENADGVAGNPAVALADVPDGGGGTLQKTAFDAKGRKTGTSVATTDDLSEGAANLYYTDGRADARAAVAIAAHVAQTDPHAQYTTVSEAAAAAPVQSVNTKAGAVVLGAADVGAQPASANLTAWAGIAPATKADASALAGKYDKTGGSITGAVSLRGNSSRFVFYDDNLDVPVIDVGAGYGTATDRNGYIANRNAAGFLEVSAFNFSRRFRLVSDGFLFNGPLYQSDDNLYSAGTASARFSVVYAGTGTINTSDAREKTPVRPLTAAELAAAIELGGEIGAYKWLEMVGAKGEAAREHIGLTVQRAIEVMRSHGLDPFARGFICYDAWDELLEVLGDEGEVVQEHRTAGDRYSFRMDELLAFIARGLAHRLDAVERRLAAAGL